MSGDNAPPINSFNDYLDAILPICFGALDMTAQEIYDSTPWEINQRIKGYEFRKRQERIFTTSFLSVPIINAGFNRPKKDVSVKDLIPDDIGVVNKDIEQGEIDMWREILSNARK